MLVGLTEVTDGRLNCGNGQGPHLQTRLDIWLVTKRESLGRARHGNEMTEL